MLFSCFNCGNVGFHDVCVTCGLAERDRNVPLDPSYYPEFRYESRGVVKDIFVKKRAERELDDKLQAVLAKYEQFADPYFVNFTQLAGQGSTEDDKLDLFHLVLVRLGFDELLELPTLTPKLVGTTSFRFQYESFVVRTESHLHPNLTETLRSWIDEQGPSFRRDLPMLLYLLWQRGFATDAVGFSAGTLPLVPLAEYSRIQKECEDIYLDIRVTRFKTALERFDPNRFMTIYRVDAMSGYEFEDFLATLFTTLGYDIETTKRSADQGADLFAQRFGRRIVIQAKRYSDNVGNAAIQQVLAARTFFGCDDAMVVSSSFFTPSARELAEGADVRLVDRLELQRYLDEYNQSIMDQAARENAEDSSNESIVPAER